MEYRGKTYTMVQGIGPNPWTWTVRVDEKTVRTGDAPTRAAAMTSVMWTVDKVLAIRKPRSKAAPELRAAEVWHICHSARLYE